MGGGGVGIFQILHPGFIKVSKCSPEVNALFKMRISFIHSPPLEF